MFDIITFGSASKDITVIPKKLTVLKYEKFASGEEFCLPAGSKVDVKDIKLNSGGGGTNAAATFSLQGFKTAFCGVVGQDAAGQEIIDELKQLKVDTKLILKKKEKMTNHSVVILGGGHDRTILVYRGASELLSKTEILWKKLKARWFYVAPLSGLLCSSLEDIINFANKNSIKVTVNPSMAQLSLNNFPEILKKIDVLFLNQEEASFLTKIPFENEQEIFKRIDQMCPGIAVMTKGRGGVTVSDGKNRYSAKAPSETKIIDTTGAGDSFASGFMSEFMRTSDTEKSIQLGMANSQACISQIGAKHGLLKKSQNFQKVEVLKNKI